MLTRTVLGLIYGTTVGADTANNTWVRERVPGWVDYKNDIYLYPDASTGDIITDYFSAPLNTFAKETSPDRLRLDAHPTDYYISGAPAPLEGKIGALNSLVMRTKRIEEIVVQVDCAPKREPGGLGIVASTDGDGNGQWGLSGGNWTYTNLGPTWISHDGALVWTNGRFWTGWHTQLWYDGALRHNTFPIQDYPWFINRNDDRYFKDGGVSPGMASGTTSLWTISTGVGWPAGYSEDFQAVVVNNDYAEPLYWFPQKLHMLGEVLRTFYEPGETTPAQTRVVLDSAGTIGDTSALATSRAKFLAREKSIFLGTFGWRGIGGGTGSSLFKNIMVYKKNHVRVIGLPLGYQVVVGSQVANASATGTTDVYLGEELCPLADIKVYNASATLLQTLAPTNGVFGGDEYLWVEGGDPDAEITPGFPGSHAIIGMLWLPEFQKFITWNGRTDFWAGSPPKDTRYTWLEFTNGPSQPPLPSGPVLTYPGLTIESIPVEDGYGATPEGGFSRGLGVIDMFLLEAVTVPTDEDDDACPCVEDTEWGDPPAAPTTTFGECP